MYIIYNADGSINKQYLNEFIQEGNSYANVLFVAIIGREPADYYLNAFAKLPNNVNIELPTEDSSLILDGITYVGKNVSITSDATTRPGSLQLNIVAENLPGTERLVSFNLYLTVNETGLAVDDPAVMTIAQYQSLLNRINEIDKFEKIELTGTSGTLTETQIGYITGSVGTYIKNGDEIFWQNKVSESQAEFLNTSHAYKKVITINLTDRTWSLFNYQWFDITVSSSNTSGTLTTEQLASLNENLAVRITRGNWVFDTSEKSTTNFIFRSWGENELRTINVNRTSGAWALSYIQYQDITTPTAQAVTYDNSNSGLDATNVQGAIDELQVKKLDNSAMEPLMQTQSVSNVIDINANNVFINSLTLPQGVENVLLTICGKNLLDTSKYVYKTIKNDSGVEVYDGGSSYFNKMIAVVPGETLYINFGAQRIYQYDINGNWLRRTSTHAISHIYGQFAVPSDCHFIQIQYSSANTAGTINWDIAQVEVGTAETTYEEYQGREITINASTTYPFSITAYGKTRLYTFVGSNFEIGYLSKEETIYIPACGDYDLWEPETTTNDYTSPIGRNNVINPITGQEFLDLYYNIYLGTNADGYKVVKRSLGDDSSHRYELIEYDFMPKHYNKTILLSAGMNPCELPAEWGLAYLIKSIMENHNDDEGLKYLYENVRIKVIPFLNPWGFDQTPKAYANYNGIRINKNFNYKDSWDSMDANQMKGTQPDSENEVKILKKWLNDNAYAADLYIDCHTDPDANTPYNIWIQFSSGLFDTLYLYNRDVLVPYWQNKGLDPDNQLNNYAGTTNYKIYPKTQYAKDICGIPAIMIEMWSNTTAFGSDPTIMNEDAEIKYYVWLLRALILKILVSPSQTYTSEDNTWSSYQFAKQNKR